MTNSLWRVMLLFSSIELTGAPSERSVGVSRSAALLFRELFRTVAFALALLFARHSPAQPTASEKKPDEPPGIQDNSFLMEEAYNQEPGVVQHINSFQRFRSGTWTASFTQEWPVPGQTHQLSYTLLYARVDSDTGSHTGFGDLALNYRYQLAGSGDAKFACATRVSVLLPSGDFRKELGIGGVGVQANIAASTVLSEKFVTHSNLGATYLPRAQNAGGDKATALGINAGQSLVWTLHRNFNALVEALWIYAETVTGPEVTQGAHTFLVSPGIRWAHNLSGLQIVPGLAVPIAVSSHRTEASVFLYLSFEHPMWTPR